MSMSKFVESHFASLAVGSVAVVASLYILYGPVKIGASRNKHHVVGLVNTGNTCFLNSVLQALAACPTLYFWLERQKSSKICSNGERRVFNNLCSSLVKVLAVLNNIEPEGNPYSPNLVISALRAHGWVINSEEQDSHEALNAILTTLEEEIKAKKNSPTKPTHASLLDISHLDDSDDSGDDVSDDEEVYSSPRFTRGTSLPPGKMICIERRPIRQAVSRDTSPVSLTKGKGHHRRSSSGVFSRFGEFSQDTLQVCNSGKEEQSPFTGMLTNKLTNQSKEEKSPVNYSSFNNITLNLPTNIGGYITLDLLLQMFISQERVEGSQPDKSLIKQLTFGKLPDCLCLHIQRTAFSGQPYKRHEYVEFPAILSMEKYIYSKQLLKQKSMSLGGNSIGASFDNGLRGRLPRDCASDLNESFQDGVLFNLRAVIVHSGGIHSGHYITYRRGPFGSKYEKKWFYTSDALVKQVSYDEVSRSCAYMLFYEREV